MQRVQVASGSRRLRNILVGAGIGLAVGLVVDQTLGVRLRNEGNDDYRGLFYAAPIALFGGLSARPAYRTVYTTK